MDNVLSNAVKDTVFIGGDPDQDAFHIALTGTADYIPHMGVVALTVRVSIIRIFLFAFISL